MEKIPRPKVVGSINVRVVTGCGNMYVQMGWWDGSLHEVFATLGRGGGCAMGFSEALTRSVTAGLRCGVPVSEFARQLRGVRCPNPVPFPKEGTVLSCPDAIAGILEQYGSLTTDNVVELIQKLNALPSGLSEEEEAAEAAKHIEELKKGREKLEE